jgi:hypothetical protein
MKKRLAASLMLFASCFAVLAAEDKPEQIAKTKANEVAQATLKGDWNKVLDSTYPGVVKQAGGREKMLDLMKRTTEQMKTKGFAFRSAQIGDTAQVVTVGDKRFAVVPLSLVMKAPRGTIAIKSFLLGISTDKGKTWTFINGDKAHDEAVKKMLPDLPASLKLPDKEKPVYTPDEDEK